MLYAVFASMTAARFLIPSTGFLSQVWRGMSDDEKLQAIADHFESSAASSKTNQISLSQTAQELFPPPPLPELSAEPASEPVWTPRGIFAFTFPST